MIYMYKIQDTNIFVISTDNLISIFKINYLNDIICAFIFSRATAVKQYRYMCSVCR